MKIYVGLCILFTMSSVHSFQVSLSSKKFWDCDGQAYCLLVCAPYSQSATLKTYVSSDTMPITRMMKASQFTADKEEVCVLPIFRGGGIAQLILVGVGEMKESPKVNMEWLRRGMGTLIQKLKKYNISQAVIGLSHLKSIGSSSQETIKQLGIVMQLADYDYKSMHGLKEESPLQSVEIVTDEPASKALLTALEDGMRIGNVMNQARYLGDLPPNIATPKFIAKYAQKIAQKHKLSSTVFGREKALKMGMGGFCAVDAGSHHEGQFVVLDYQPDSIPKKTIVLVGKGVTFDTGGVTLKSRTNMSGMKYDMCGAASVLATMDLVGFYKPDVRVVGITPLVENMPGGGSFRQDDVIRFLNGKTAEVISTDAVGRLILADALSYASIHYKPDVMIDIATLTGGCWHALGPYFSGILTRNDELYQILKEVSEKVGDPIWRLPLTDDYKHAITSSFADILNRGSDEISAHATTAALFLENFVGDTSWVHLDIAAASVGMPHVSYMGQWTTGAGIRLLTEYILQQSA